MLGTASSKGSTGQGHSSSSYGQGCGTVLVTVCSLYGQFSCVTSCCSSTVLWAVSMSFLGLLCAGPVPNIAMDLADMDENNNNLDNDDTSFGNGNNDAKDTCVPLENQVDV